MAVAARSVLTEPRVHAWSSNSSRSVLDSMANVKMTLDAMLILDIASLFQESSPDEETSVDEEISPDVGTEFGSDIVVSPEDNPTTDMGCWMHELKTYAVEA